MEHVMKLTITRISINYPFRKLIQEHRSYVPYFLECFLHATGIIQRQEQIQGGDYCTCSSLCAYSTLNYIALVRMHNCIVHSMHYAIMHMYIHVHNYIAIARIRLVYKKHKLYSVVCVLCVYVCVCHRPS